MHDDSHDGDERVLAALAVHALIGTLAHDLVGPLGTQLGYLDLLGPHCRSEEAKGYLARASKQSKKLVELIEQWRDGISEASEPLRRPIEATSLRQLLGTELHGAAVEACPVVLAYAARLCLVWWKEQQLGGVPEVILRSDEHESSLELVCPGAVAPADDPWEPSEKIGASTWSLYLARLFIRRAHGRFSSRTENDGCRLTLSVPH